MVPVLAKIYSAAVYGVEAFEGEIGVNAGHGNSNIIIVGLPDAAVKESRDRVRAALANGIAAQAFMNTTLHSPGRGVQRSSCRPVPCLDSAQIAFR